MQLLLIPICKGCGATMIPVTTDTAWLDDALVSIKDAIQSHRETAEKCPYFLGVEVT